VLGPALLRPAGEGCSGCAALGYGLPVLASTTPQVPSVRGAVMGPLVGLDVRSGAAALLQTRDHNLLYDARAHRMSMALSGRSGWFIQRGETGSSA